MNSYTSKLILKLIRNKIDAEVEKILDITQQGFDVYIKCQFPEVRDLLVLSLEENALASARGVHLLRSLDEIPLANETKRSEGPFLFVPRILVTEEEHPFGYGFISFELGAPDNLLSSVPSAIEQILEYFKLDIYLEVFDGMKLSKLRQIAKKRGVGALIDAVVQIAYLSGYQGDQERAEQFLEMAVHQEMVEEESLLPLERCAEIFLSHVVSMGDSAHLFLKSCLSYYAVSKQGHTVTHASRMLSISRTTLSEHLRAADKLGVNEFFEGALNFRR